MSHIPKDSDLELKFIRSIDLPHPDGQLLECFFRESIDCTQAGRYIRQRVGDDGLGLENFMSDWKQLINLFIYEGPTQQLHDKAINAEITKRDRGRCCISGRGNSLWDPLVVAPILPTTEIHVNENLQEMLGVFVGSDLRDWVLSKAALLNTYQNHWLVRKSAAAALAQGYFRFTLGKGLEYRVSLVRIGGPIWPSIVAKTGILRSDYFTNHSVSCVDTPDFSVLELLSRFAAPIRWSMVAREVASKKPKTASNFNLPLASLWRWFSERGAAAVFMAWRLVPASIRIRTYYGLAFLGARMYDNSSSSKVQRLPFGMYVKMARARNHDSLANEYATLQLVQRHTHIPVPRALDLVSNSKVSCLLTSRVSGIRLGLCIDTLTENEEATLISDLQKSLDELRAIPKVVAPEYAISDARGKACYDYRITAGIDYYEGAEFVGPFVNEEEFNKLLQVGALPGVSHCGGHQIVFTHGDLNMRNVLVHNGKLSGIVDWENSGWYPEYWDYTKALYVTKLNRRWLKMTDKVFKRYGDFETELATEFQLWHYCF